MINKKNYGPEMGMRKYSIPPIYSINILNFKLAVFNDTDRFLWEVQLKDQLNKVFLPQIKFIFIELCTSADLFREGENRDALHCWLYIIKNMGDEQTLECPFDDPIYHDFFEEGKIEKLTTMEKEDYAKSIFNYQDVKDTIEFERDRTRKEGEAIAKLAMAKSLLDQGVAIDIIVKTSGLSVEEIMK